MLWDAPVTYLTKITLSLEHAMRSGNSRCKIAKPDTANHWRACWSVPLISPGWRRMHFGIMGSPPPSFFLCSAAPSSVHFTHMAMAAAPVKESDAGEGESHKTRETVDGRCDGGQMRIRSQPRTFMARFRVGSERESEVSFWIELHFASAATAVPSILRSKDAADPISIVGLESGGG